MADATTNARAILVEPIEPTWIDGDGQAWWERAGGMVRSDPTGRGPWDRVYLVTADARDAQGMSIAAARTLAQILLAAADYAESGDSGSGGSTP